MAFGLTYEKAFQITAAVATTDPVTVAVPVPPRGSISKLVIKDTAGAAFTLEVFNTDPNAPPLLNLAVYKVMANQVAAAGLISLFNQNFAYLCQGFTDPDPAIMKRDANLYLRISGYTEPDTFDVSIAIQTADSRS